MVIIMMDLMVMESLEIVVHLDQVRRSSKGISVK